jgi:hypothetical protein
MWWMEAMAVVSPVYETDALDFYNNTLNGVGAGFGVELAPNTHMPSLRNNVFYDFRSQAVVFADPPPANKTDAVAGLLDYADYNCFYCPNAQKPDNYNALVKGKTERKDAGFALNDLPKGGKVDEQCDPKFKGPIPEKFPFEDEDVKSGKVTVSQILKFYRDAYTPAEGSPLIDAGDPADGEGTDIGAVDAGKPAKVRGF